MALFLPMNFLVALFHPSGDSKAKPGAEQLVCEGAFSEVTGLEATMSVKTLKEGGRNWGEVQLAGPTAFSPLVLKRGVTETTHLWDLMDFMGRQANYAYRLQGRIEVFDQSRDASNGGEKRPLLTWTLRNVMPTKFKGPDLSATASQIAVEELHLVYEGLELVRRPFDAPSAPQSSAGGGGNAG
ncbi:MAG: phage tail protein [Pseudomonadota bacterium]